MASLFGFLGRKTSDDGAEYGAFHVKCGSNIVLSNGRRTAHGKGAFNGNIVYSSKPFPTGGKFQMKVLEKDLFGPIVSNNIILSCICSTMMWYRRFHTSG